MLNKKIVAMTLAISMVAAAFVGCGKNEKPETATNNTTKNAEEKKDEEKKDEEKKEETKKVSLAVGLVTDEGGINDKSFNQSADEGIKEAGKSIDLDYNYIESESKDDYEENLEALIDDGKAVIFGIGFQMGDAVKAIAAKFPESKIAIIDYAYDDPSTEENEQPANVHSIVYKEQEGSFLVGVIAGLTTKTNKVGFIGGKDFGLINRFEVGFAAGVMSVNPEAGKLLASRQMVKYADSFSDTNKGYELGKALYNEGADVVYHAAGGVGNGLFTATKELRDAGNDVWAIGVDKDQAIALPKMADVILTSMMKRVDTGTMTVVNDVAAGKFQGGTITPLGLKEDGVGIAATSKNHVSEEILTKVEEYKKAIINGEIVVPATIDELKTFEVK